MRCIRTGKPNLEVNGPHFEDEVALKDKSGRTIGAVAAVFNYKPGDDKQRMVATAEQIGSEMQRQLPGASRLFGANN
jgi:hypothetical protein